MRPCPSYPGYSADEYGNVYGPRGRALKGRVSFWGYSRIHVSFKGTTQWVHRSRLVCDAFYGPHPDDKPFALHGAAGRSCDRPDNLRWGDAEMNEHDRLVLGENRPVRYGQDHPNARLTDEQVAEIRECAGFIDQYTLAERYKISQSHVSNILARKTRA